MGRLCPSRSAIALLLLCSALAGMARSAPESPLRVVVWVASDGDRAFLTRLRGQTVDLPVQLIEAQAERLDPVLDRQVAVAQTLARSKEARVVIWRFDDHVMLYQATPPPSHLLVRRVGGGAPRTDPGANHGSTESTAAATDSPAAASAGLEAAALIVRSALTAILEGGTVGVPRTEPAVLPPPSPSQSVVAPEGASSSSPLSVFMLGAWQTAWDGLSDGSSQGIAAHLGLGWGRLAGGLAGMATFDRLVGTRGTQPLWRQNGTLFVGADIVRASRFRLTGEVQGGIAAFNLTQLAGNVTTTTRFVLGGELRGAFDVLTRGPLRLWLWVGGGADYIPNTVHLTRGQMDVVVRESWKLQPRALVGLGFGFR